MEDLALFKNREGVGCTGLEYILLSIKEVVDKNIEEKTFEDCDSSFDSLLECKRLVDDLLYHNYFSASDNYQLWTNGADIKNSNDLFNNLSQWSRLRISEAADKSRDIKKLFKHLLDIQEMI